MVQLSFKQTKAEIMVRIASTLLFNQLVKANSRIVSVREITENIQYGYTEKATESEIGPKYVRITDLKDGRVNWDTVPYCKCDEPEQYLLKQNDLIFARTGATTGKTHLFRDVPPYAVFASYLIRVRPKKAINPEYLYYFFQSDLYWSQVSGHKEGSAQPNVNGQKLSVIELPITTEEIQKAVCKFLAVVRARQDGLAQELPELPQPLTEQGRIVTHIESLAARVNEAQRLREEVEEGISAFVASYHVHYADKVVKLGDILTLDEDKETIKPEGSYPQIGVKGFGKGLFARETLSGTQTTYKWFNRLYYGAIVLSQVKGWEGAIGVVDKSLVGKFASPEYRTFRCKSDKAMPEYFSELFATPWFYLQLKTLSRGVGGRRERIRPELFVELEIPMPDIERQKLAVEVFAKFPALRELQSASGEELSALMPSILDKAFKGEL
jgi:type I restriction enzyme, S subunit